MTLESLQRIISFEDELFAKEQHEQGKAVQWLQAQKAELTSQLGENLANLEKKIDQSKKRAEKQAKKEAALIFEQASNHADSIDEIMDKALKGILEKRIKGIVGCEK